MFCGRSCQISSPEPLSAMMAGSEPAWLTEMTCPWPEISPSKFNSIHHWPKDNALVTALVLLVETDFGNNQFSLDCGHFPVFYYVNSESFSFFPPCFWGRKSPCRCCHFLLAGKMYSRVWISVLFWLFFRTCHEFFIASDTSSSQIL